MLKIEFWRLKIELWRVYKPVTRNNKLHSAGIDSPAEKIKGIICFIVLIEIHWPEEIHE
jgi:hypothetical protein